MSAEDAHTEPGDAPAGEPGGTPPAQPPGHPRPWQVEKFQGLVLDAEGGWVMRLGDDDEDLALAEWIVATVNGAEERPRGVEVAAPAFTIHHPDGRDEEIDPRAGAVFPAEAGHA